MYDVGYDETSGQFSYRDIHGATSDQPPVATTAGICAYAHDGTTTPAVSPPPSSTVVLCPESSGGWCYYNTGDGTSSWFPPAGSTTLRSRTLSDAHTRWLLVPSQLPPALSNSVQLNSLRHTGWSVLHRDATNEVWLVNTSTGSIREAPWIALRTSGGTVYFANLVSRETRWLPPLGWMEGWVARRPIDERSGTPASIGHPHAHLQLDRVVDDRLPLIGTYSRECVEGGAPYLHERGRPQYLPDEYDTPFTYPLDGFVQVRDQQISDSGTTWPWPTFLLAQCQISRNRFQPQTLKFPGNFREICHFFLSERGRT